MANGKRAARLSADEVQSVETCAALTDDERKVLVRFYGIGRDPQTEGQIAHSMRINGYNVRRLRDSGQNKVRGAMAAKA